VFPISPLFGETGNGDLSDLKLKIFRQIDVLEKDRLEELLLCGVD